MPELPDLTVYREALERRIAGVRLARIRLASPFLVRSFDPPLDAAYGRVVTAISLIGKRVVFSLEEEHHLVLHLMVAGRLRWCDLGAGVPKRNGLAAFDFGGDPGGSLVLTEASKKKRASLHLVVGADALSTSDRGGIDPLTANDDGFAEAITRENRTLKRALTDPRILSGIGNAYSDEILHRAGLSPVSRTQSLSPEAISALRTATRTVLVESTERLRAGVGDAFPEKVTAFRDEMAVHGKYGQPCPTCATAVQRIRYADKESNYCPRCQTGGKLLADRSLSRLLKNDWPRTIDELEAIRGRNG